MGAGDLAKLLNHRLVKLHRSYSVEEAAHCLGAHKHSLRRWIKDGLPTVGGKGPILILGAELRAFLEARRSAAKRPSPPGHLYCFKCREPRLPAAKLAEYAPVTAASGDLQALCSDCLTIMHRRIKAADLASVWAHLEVTHLQPPPHLSGLTRPYLNGDSR
jgi:hypothetical protein